MNKLLIIFTCLSFTFCSFGQTKLDVLFVKHLAETESYKECIFEVDRGDFSLSSQNIKDSITFYKGWSQYSLKDLNESANTFLSISKKSSFYTQSHLFAAYNYAHIGKYSQAMLILDDLQKSSLVSFEKAGVSLLERDYETFYKNMKMVDTTKYYLSVQSHRLYKYSKVLESHKYKSPLLAAGLSTIIPGLGKIYAGKTGEGLSSFFACAGLGLVTLEQYNKNGIKDYRTIIASSLFSLFYIGNIWGSYFTVLITENEFDDEYKNKILFNIHIPLRTFFK